MPQTKTPTLERLLLPSVYLLAACFCAVFAASTAFAESREIRYPETKRVDQVDVYHGVEVADPYRWLEDDVRVSEQTADWVAAQNEVTFGYLKSLPQRALIQDRLQELWNYERYSQPFKAGGRYFYTKNDGLQNQAVFYMTDSLDSEGEVLLDPNTWSEDGTVSMAGFNVSDDGRYAVYGVREAGSDWRHLKLMRLDTREILDDEIHWIKWGGVSWTPDNRGFFYTRFPQPEEGAEFQSLNKNAQTYYHYVGTSQEDDVLVYEDPANPDWTSGVFVTEDGRYLARITTKGTGSENLFHVRDLAEPYATFVPVIREFENDYTYINNDGKTFFFRTDLDAPKGRVIAIHLDRPEPEHWREIIPESENRLTFVNMVANLFVARYLEDAKTAVKIYRTDGRYVRDVEFPALGSANGFGGRRSDTEAFYTFTSFATPPSIYRYDFLTGESTVFRRPNIDVDSSAYTVRQVFYKSKDGTRVPMFIAHRKDLELDGTNPTLLFGYGGFDVSLTPGFNVARLAWMEMGGVFAMPNLRGGGEYGEAWHEAGTKLNKQNVFDDFIAAAEWLIDNKYTSNKKLAIQGGSNGGLLVGATMTQRPELFGAALPAVGVMDMLRFHRWTAGRYWVDDYGSSDNPEEFKALLAYSPYHNLKKGTEYPPTLVTTADTDDRVVPGHSFKFAAALQHAHKGDNPVLIRIESRAGHGGGTPTKKRIEQTADLWAFLAEHLDMEIVPRVERDGRPQG